MADTMPFIIGEAAACDDGDCGEVSRFVVDPVALTMTHLVIAPKHGHQPGRLVPLSLVDDAARGVALRCTVAEFDKLDQAQETQYVPPAAGYDGHGPGRAGAQSLAPLSGGWGMAYGMSGRLGVASSTSPGSKNIAHTVVRDIVPAGEVEIGGAERVYAADGEVGLVAGLVIDRRDHQVTQVLVRHGHLRGRKDVAVPVSAVTGIRDVIRLSLTGDQVRALRPAQT